MVPAPPVRTVACMPATAFARRRGLVVALVVIAAGCADAETPVTRADYLSDLQTICASTTAELEALPEPPELISVADFATSAADSLDREAQRVDRLVVPDVDDSAADDPNSDDPTSIPTAITGRSLPTPAIRPRRGGRSRRSPGPGPTTSPTPPNSSHSWSAAATNSPSRWAPSSASEAGCDRGVRTTSRCVGVQRRRCQASRTV